MRTVWRGKRQVALCENCARDRHGACTERGCMCLMDACAFTTKPAGGSIRPDGRVYWDDKEQTMDHAQRRTNAENEAIKVAHIDYDDTVIRAVIPVEVLEALTSRAAKYDALAADGQPHISLDGTLLTWRGENYVRQDMVSDWPRDANGNITPGYVMDVKTPLIVKADGATIDRIGVANRDENGDPMYQRAKKALEEIGVFRSVNVEHETDIITTSDDRGGIANYRSGINEVTITIRGYLR